MADPMHWSAAVKRWLREDRLALVIIAFATLMQVVIAMRMFAPGELAGDDMSIHLAEIAGIARSLAAGDLDLWNPSANGGFASGYFYQFLPQLGCAILYLFFGALISLSTLFKITVLAALIAVPLTVYRAMRVIGADVLVAAAAGLGACTVFAASGWGAGIDSLFSTGLYTQAFALAFYPLALAYAARYLSDGVHLGRALIYALLTGFCHPFIAFAIAPPLLFLPWWRIGGRKAALRCAVLAGGALLGSAPLWLPILVDYDAFGGFPARVKGEEGIRFGVFVSEFQHGAFLDLGRRAVTTALLAASFPVVFLRRGRLLLPLYLSGLLFAGFIMLGPVLGKTEGDLLPAVRFLAPMQLFLGAAAWAAFAIGVRELVAVAGPRAPRWFRTSGAVVLVLLVGWLVAELGAGVATRAKLRVRTVYSFDNIKRDELARVISFLETQPPGRVFAASELGSGSHWWMYLPYVYADKPAVRAYGGAALQSSPSYVYLRAADFFTHHALFATRYLIASAAAAEGDRWREQFAALDGDIIYELGGYRVYALGDASLFRAVTPVGWIDGDRAAKTKRILAWMRSKSFATDAALVEGEPIAPVAAPDDVIIEETRHSRRSHAARLRVNGASPALIRLAVTFHPGWRVTVDGRRAPVRRVSPAFVAVVVPPGSHEVRFTFVRPAWTWLLYALLLAAIAGVVVRQRRRKRLVAAATLGLFFMLSPAPATAQPDSFPMPVDAAFHDDGRAIVATRAGLLVRKRAGDPFAYVCPDVSGSKSGAFAPHVAIRGDGTFAATSYNGLRESRDGCGFERMPVFDGDGRRISKDLWFVDLAVSPPDQLWAATADSHSDNDIFLSSQPRSPLESARRRSDRFWYISVVPTPSGAHTYASGYMVAGKSEAEVLKLLLVDDQVAPAFGLEAGRSGRVRVALAPSADELYVVSEAALEPRGDVLFFSRDRARNFEAVLETPAAIVGVARDRAGSTWVATETSLLRALPDTNKFELMLAAQAACLVNDETGALIICRRDAASSGEMLSRIEEQGGAVSLAPVLRSRDIGAPCGFDCSDAWERACVTFAADCTANPTEPVALVLTAEERDYVRGVKQLLLVGALGVGLLIVVAVIVYRARRR